MRHSAEARLPTLALPSLAVSAADAVDASSLNFLLGPEPCAAEEEVRGGEEGKGGGGEGGGGAGAA